ncbi:MAG: hypothetical protein ABIT01_08175 [Thermoanaerobaculia bacterium]
MTEPKEMLSNFVSDLSTLKGESRRSLLADLAPSLEKGDVQTIVQSSPDPAGIVQDATATLGQADQKSVVTASLRNLPEKDRAEVVSSVGPPTPPALDKLWMIVIWSLAIVLVGSFATVAISIFVPLPENSPGPQMALTVFTSVVGFLAGLFAPSPVAKHP